MELNKTKRWFYGLTFLWVILLLGLGAWWLYLVFSLHSSLSGLHLPELGDQERFINMIKWEGTFFFVFLCLLGGSLFGMYFRDMKKTKALQAFFSSLSHELKTPLASMRLQAEVIKDLIEDESHSHDQLSELTKRLIEDTYNFESELEKSLQLSRIEQNAPLSLASLSLERFLKHLQQKFAINLQFDFAPDTNEILADELGLKMIFRNLIENSKRHNKDLKKIEIKVKRQFDFIEVTYDDFGHKFTGDENQLGNLFYKYNSTKGSGIGLYIIKSLMKKMGGDLKITNYDRLKFILSFKAPGVNDV
jgi:signal transduction histidine kinase